MDKDNKNTMCKADALALFEHLWELYPVKKGKGSQKALERYHDKIHELIRMCCPLESFTQEQAGR